MASETGNGPAPDAALGSRRAFLAGTTGSGKTHFLLRAFLRHERRILVVDQTGEWGRYFPDAGRPAQGLGQTIDALRRATRERAWRLLCYLEPEELEVLTERALVPPGRIDRGFSAAVGGMALVVDEVDLLVPGTAARAELRGLWRRGRHARLSVYAATQRPGSVSKEVTALCEWLAILRLDEPNDIDYLARRFGRELFAWGLGYVQAGTHRVFLFNTWRRAAWRVGETGRIEGSRGLELEGPPAGAGSLQGPKVAGY